MKRVSLLSEPRKLFNQTANIAGSQEENCIVLAQFSANPRKAVVARMYGCRVHACRAHSRHDLVKTRLLMRTSPLGRRFKNENAVAAFKHVIIPFEFVAIAPRKRVRLEHDNQASLGKMLFHCGNGAFGLVIRRSKPFKNLQAGAIRFSVELAYNAAKARHRRYVLLDGGKTTGKHKGPNPNHIFDIVRSEQVGLYSRKLTPSLDQREVRDCAVFDLVGSPIAFLETEGHDIALHLGEESL